jgi:hypothetical protein
LSQFWKQHQKYKTLCLGCIALNKEQERKKHMEGFGADFHSDSDGDQIGTWVVQGCGSVWHAQLGAMASKKYHYYASPYRV